MMSKDMLLGLSATYLFASVLPFYRFVTFDELEAAYTVSNVTSETWAVIWLLFLLPAAVVGVTTKWAGHNSAAVGVYSMIVALVGMLSYVSDDFMNTVYDSDRELYAGILVAVAVGSIVASRLRLDGLLGRQKQGPAVLEGALRQAARLRDSGMLSEEEFTARKGHALGAVDVVDDDFLLAVAQLRTDGLLDDEDIGLLKKTESAGPSRSVDALPLGFFALTAVPPIIASILWEAV